MCYVRRGAPPTEHRRLRGPARPRRRAALPPARGVGAGVRDLPPRQRGPHRVVERRGRAAQGLRRGRGPRPARVDLLPRGHHARERRREPRPRGPRGPVPRQGLARAQGRVAVLRRRHDHRPPQPRRHAPRLREGHEGRHRGNAARRGARPPRPHPRRVAGPRPHRQLGVEPRLRPGVVVGGDAPDLRARARRVRGRRRRVPRPRAPRRPRARRPHRRGRAGRRPAVFVRAPDRSPGRRGACRRRDRPRRTRRGGDRREDDRHRPGRHRAETRRGGAPRRPRSEAAARPSPAKARSASASWRTPRR